MGKVNRWILGITFTLLGAGFLLLPIARAEVTSRGGAGRAGQQPLVLCLHFFLSSALYESDDGPALCQLQPAEGLVPYIFADRHGQLEREGEPDVDRAVGRRRG